MRNAMMQPTTQNRSPRPAAVRRALAIAAAVPALLGAGLGSPTSAATYQVGPQPDGSMVTPDDQVLTPAGTQVTFNGRPDAVAVSPDGKKAAFLTGYQNFITVVDLASGTVQQQLNFGGSGSFAGILYSADGSRLYASDSNGNLLIATVAADGTLAVGNRVSLNTNNFNPFPGGLALSADGKTLYVALSGYNTLGVFDLASQKLVAQVPVGNAPHSVAVRGTTAYVTNQGGRPASGGDFTDGSYGTQIVANTLNGGPITGTVSVVNLTAGAVTATIPVGLEPSALLLDPTRSILYVANTNSDTVSVIDATKNQVVRTINTQPYAGALYGSHPNALLLLPDGRLVVSLGRNNALAVYQMPGLSQPAVFQGLLPTAWYPGGLAYDAVGGRIVVANVKGLGSRGPKRPTSLGPLGYYVQSNLGSASLIPNPSAADLAAGDAQVAQNNGWNVQAGSLALRARRAVAPRAAVAPHAIPAHIGDPSLITHVFYIIKENRTYDQLLGDLTDSFGSPRGNGDPYLVEFGQNTTPNHHALAQRFPLLDNFYCSGTLSADGHQWTDQADAPDYLEKMFGNFVRSYPYNGGDSLAYLPSGFLWENAQRAGKSVRIYGEYANNFNEVPGANSQYGDWTAWYNDSLILERKKTGTLHVRLGDFQATSDVPSSDKLLSRDYPPFDTEIPDQYRVDIFLRDFKRYVAQGNLPNLTILTICDDHTSGISQNFPTPDAQLADNDLALGRLVDAISHSPYWASSAIFVAEDDSQSGEDHVDAHRSPAYAISPYAKTGTVDSTYYTQVDMVRTIEQILGLPPMNQLDTAATPMFTTFQDAADLTPYTALPANVPLNTLIASAGAGKAQRAWVKLCTALFSHHTHVPDTNDPALLNRAIWYGVKGFHAPYPGDKAVLLPSQVVRTPHPTADRD